MIIVTQDEETIVNFDDVTKIYIKNPFENNDGKFEIRAENVWNVEILGYYKTKERAKEIFKDISLRYEAIELCKREHIMPDILGYTIGDYTPVYEMPKE